MAVVPVEKIHIVVHKSVKDAFLSDLQREGIVHITQLADGPASNDEMISRINEALNRLSVLKKKELLETFVKVKKPIEIDQYIETGEAYDYTSAVEEAEQIKTSREADLSLLRNLEDNLKTLTPWEPMDYDIGSLWALRTTESIPCTVASEEKLNELRDVLADIPHSFEVINVISSMLFCIFFVERKQASSLRTKLAENDCEIIDLSSYTGVPARIIKDVRQRIRAVKHQLEVIDKREAALLNETAKLEVASDFLLNRAKKVEIAGSLPETEHTANIIGWIRKRDLKRLEKLIKDIELAIYERIKPEADERPPVAIKNPKWSSPYEMLIKLYSMPNNKEYDPTPFLAIFFPLFFSLCLTDAIYGIFLMIFSLFLMKRVAGDKSLLWILFAGGAFTVFSGSMVGGWAGNLFDLIGISFLKNFKDSLMLFDPLITPMPFFYLALAIGYLHTLLGILIEVYDDIRNRAYATAVFENLTWFLILTGLLAYFLLFKNFSGRFIFGYVCILSAAGIIVFSNRTNNPRTFDQVAWYLIVSIALIKLIGSVFKINIPQFALYVCAGLLVLEIVRIRESKKMISCIIWGLYNLYGISSFLSNVLSYIRLMALGMVTGGIALTVNLIAWMVIKIPYVGIVLAILILIGGHLFNTIINTLGGFIHTLRLQYIEFFGRFYSGGGRPFKPFKIETKYVEVNS
jgi:V/A-type H+-transporting ATPase subunit I